MLPDVVGAIGRLGSGRFQLVDVLRRGTVVRIDADVGTHHVVEHQETGNALV